MMTAALWCAIYFKIFSYMHLYRHLQPKLLKEFLSFERATFIRLPLKMIVSSSQLDSGD